MRGVGGLQRVARNNQRVKPDGKVKEVIVLFSEVLSTASIEAKPDFKTYA